MMAIPSRPCRPARASRPSRPWRPARAVWVLCFALALAAVAAACGGSKSSTGGSNGTGGTSTVGATGGGGHGTGGQGIVIVGSGGGCATPGLDVQPSALQTITVPAGTTAPTVTFTATLDCMPVNAGWSVDKGNVGSVPGTAAPSAIFTPTGTTGGTVTVTAAINNMTAARQVLVKLTATQNGPNTTPGEVAQIPTMTAQLTAGGGVGGVGGEGLGPAVTDPATLTALGSPTMSGSSQGLVWLYPYDKTVWPRGLLAPLLQWYWTTGDADAIQIQLSTQSGSYTYTGTFAKPAILGPTGKLTRMPIPQDVWDAATNSAGGTDTLTVALTLAKAGVGYGPISQTWTIAPARLSGTIYYQSYGTQLAKNYYGAVGGDKWFGGAVLSIHVGDTGPKLVAGSTSQTGDSATDNAHCRVCHSVAALGARLVVQHGENYGTSSAYDLGTTPATEHVLANGAEFPAVYPDGSLILTPQGSLFSLPADPTPLTSSGLTVSNLGQPAFSPDGTQIVFNPLSGTVLTLPQTLYVMSYAGGTHAFSGATLIAKDTAPAQPGWPAFFPDSKSVIYGHQTVASSCEGGLETRSGARSQIYWTNLAGPSSVTPLDQLNGKGYLPKLAAPSPVACNDACGTSMSPTIGTVNGDHGDDVDVNYEPTVNPIPSGGYAWVVFTSRRMYGSVATIGSFCSDPRGVDLIGNVTPKKLWVAAVDLTQAPGVDSSHPAFYLPAQEILAGNARGFWVLDPCQADGTTCATGDQCCNGYCEPGDGGLVCTSAPPAGTCSGVQEKCSTSGDCCDPTNLCINGFCTVKGPT